MAQSSRLKTFSSASLAAPLSTVEMSPMASYDERGERSEHGKRSEPQEGWRGVWGVEGLELHRSLHAPPYLGHDPSIVLLPL